MQKKILPSLTKDPVGFVLGRLTSNQVAFPNFRFNRLKPANYELIDVHSLNDVDAGVRRATLRAKPGAEATGEVAIEWNCIPLTELATALPLQPAPFTNGAPFTVQALIEHINATLNANLGTGDVVAYSGGASPTPLPYNTAIPTNGSGLSTIKLVAKSTPVVS